MRKSVTFAVVAVTASFFISTEAEAVVTGNWIGANPANWNTSTSWLNGITPNGQGDIAQFTTGQANGTGTSSIAVNDVPGGVTVGTLKVLGPANGSMQFTPTQTINLNQDGAGPLMASVINDIQSTGATSNPAIFLNTGAGNFVLQDDLFISNTSNSTRGTGSVQIRGTINGNGNLYVENVSNNIAAAQIAFTNVESGAGLGFGGDVFLNKGAVTMSRGDVFTPGNKNIRFGTAGIGDVTLGFVGGAVGGMEYNFISEPNNGHTNLFVAAATSTDPVLENRNVVIRSTFTNVGNVILNGPMTFENRVSTGSTLVVGDRISGVAGFTKIGPGPMRLTNTNSYQGGTIVNEGTLVVTHTDAIDSMFGHHDPSDGTLGTGSVTINSSITSPTKLQIDTSIANINVIANSATLSLAGGGTADVADQAYADLGAGVKEVVGTLLLGGVAQTAHFTYGSTSSNAVIKSDEFFAGTGVISVGLAGDYNNNGEVDAADYVTWSKNPATFGGSGGYDLWRQSFGDVAVPGAGANLGGLQTVPEPGTLLMAVVGGLLAYASRRRR